MGAVLVATTQSSAALQQWSALDLRQQSQATSNETARSSAGTYDVRHLETPPPPPSPDPGTTATEGGLPSPVTTEPQAISSPVPEPGSLSLLALGMLGAGIISRKRRR